MDTSIVSIGEELLYGRTRDANAAFLGRELGLRGFHPRRLLIVGDDPERLEVELRRCAEDSELIVMSGGLGPTADDRTRRAIAAAAGKSLVEDGDSRRHVIERLASYGHEASEEQLAQAFFPAGSSVFPNPRGTARGFACRMDGAWLAAMPGVPDEMRPMFRESVLPFLIEELRPAGCIEVETVHLFPMAESKVDERIRDLTAEGRNPYVGITVSDGIITVSVSAAADTLREAQELLQHDLAVLKERFGDRVFGTGDATLGSALAEAAQAEGATLAVAESLTGGLVGRMLVDVPGVSELFLGDVVAYSNQAKIERLGVPAGQVADYGAVSPEVAESMARGACDAFGSTLAVSTTGIAGPTGGTPEKPIGLVYVGVCLHGETAVRELNLRGDRWHIMDRAAKYALNFARLALTNGIETLNEPA